MTLRRRPRGASGLVSTVLACLVLVASSAACSGGDDGVDDGSAATDPVVTAEVSEGSRPGGDATDGGAEADEADGDTVDAAVRPPAPAGTLVWITGTEPPDLHLDDPANGLTVTAWIREGLLESLFGVGPDLTYHPELLAGEPTLTARDDKSVVIDYELRSGLRWSDGTALTSEDVAYTHRILTEGCRVEGDGSILDNSPEGCVYRTTGRVGLDQVTDFEVVSDTRFRVTMAAFDPDWRSLFSPVLAAHAYGDDAAQVNRRLATMRGPSRPLPSSGPLVFDSWDRGASMTLLRNDEYHGSTAPDVDNDGVAAVEAVRIDFEPDPTARVEAVLEGRADLLMERSIVGHDALIGAEGVEVTPVPGHDYEHWGLNLLNPHLAKPEVRAAIADAIDKTALAEEVLRPLVGPDASVDGLGNTYWLASQPPYVDHQEGYAGARVDEARSSLSSAGYDEGSDGVFRHPSLGRLSLRVTTVGGDPVREAVQAVLVEQLAAAGIEAEIDNLPGGLFFQQGPFSADALAASASGGDQGDGDLWDIAQFSWAGGPWPGGQSGAYRNGSVGNPYGFNNAEFEVEAFECDAVVDDGERADCYNGLDRFVTTLERGEDGLFMIPLFQRPVTLAVATGRVEAAPVVIDDWMGGPLAAVVDYRLGGQSED